MAEYSLLDWSELIANFSVIGGVIVVAFSIANFRTSVQYSRAQLFLNLRDNFADVRTELARELPGFADGDYDVPFGELPERGQAAVRRYWTNAFDEWCATTKIYKSGRGVLWRTFYANAQSSALVHRPFREGLLDMMRGPYSFGGFKRDYQRAIRQLARNLLAGRTGVPLTDALERDIAEFLAALDAIPRRRRNGT